MPKRATLAIALCFSGLLSAQSGGLPPEWEVKKSMDDFAVQYKRLEPVLAQVKPQEWVSKGAPDAYVRQLKSCQDELGYLLGAAAKLGNQPDKMTVGLETYFRAEALQTLVESLVAGTRKYQNPALAELLMSELNGTSLAREKLRKYLTDLADDKEKEFRMVDAEAQRCRASLIRQAPAAPPKPTGKAVQK